MTWMPDTTFNNGLDFFTDVAARLEPDDWAKPSPCEGWQALDVLGHVGIATRFGVALLAGKAPEWVPVDPPRDSVEGDPFEWWAALVDPAKAAVSGTDLAKVVDSPRGRRSIGEGLSFPAFDLFVHGWDLARTTGHDVEIPQEAIDFGHQVIDPIPDDMKRSQRVFAAEMAVGDDASPTDRVIAWTGRDPHWTPSN